MRVLIIGKKQQMHWPENVAKFLPDDCERDLFLYNQKTFRSLWDKFCSHNRWAHRAVAFRKRIESFKPDIILFVSAFFVPVEFYRVAAAFKNVLKVGWAGDAFGENVVDRADLLDILFCSDTGYLKVAEKFKCSSDYLPLCADENVFQNQNLAHTLPPFFAGNANPIRTDYLKAIQQRVNIYGSHWDKTELAQHNVHNIQLSHTQLSHCYNTSVAPINMTFSQNIINGLNFRIFEIGAAGGLIIVNEGNDLPMCYQVGVECVTYRTPEELNALIEDILKAPEKYQEIARQGYLRTLREHTYTKRLEQMLKKITEYQRLRGK